MAFKEFSNIIIKFDNFEEDVKVLLKEIRPTWDLNAIKIKRFHEGISNILFGVHSDVVLTNSTDMILVRIYGISFVNRNMEMEMMAALSEHGLSAKVYGKFANGCAYQFIHGTVLDVSDMRDEHCTSLIINEFVKFHTIKLQLNKPKHPFVFTRMREIANCLPDQLSDPNKNKKYLTLFPNKSTIFQEIECLEHNLMKPIYPLALCHNDLLVHNMILNDKKDRIHFIDFEYTDYNYIGFDIGNHFNEFAGLQTVDYSLYPGEIFQKNWIKKYLQTRQAISTTNGNVINGGDKYDIDDKEIEFWYKMVNKFSLSSHLLWCIWSILQDQNSEIDFDYISYGILRWNQYISRKDFCLAM